LEIITRKGDTLWIRMPANEVLNNV
jgi:hypothetical protein